MSIFSRPSSFFKKYAQVVNQVVAMRDKAAFN